MDLREMLIDLHRMRLELERELETGHEDLVKRAGSVRGRNLHVFNTLRRIQRRNNWKRDYVREEEGRVIVYVTSCGIVRKTWEKCRDTVQLLRALHVRVDVRDLNMNPRYMDELIDRMELGDSDRELVYDSLPMVYVNGRYFGNDSTLFEENEKMTLRQRLCEFQGRRDDCTNCNGSGYTVCEKCRGGKKTEKTFEVRLRCAACDRNGIAPCTFCSPKTTY